MTTDKERLSALLASGDYILSLGAGAAVCVGLKTWDESLLAIASELEKQGETDYASLIRRQTTLGRPLEAADLLYNAPLLDKDRDAILQKTFTPTVQPPPSLMALVSRQNAGIVTTNYDRSLLDAAGRGGIGLAPFGREASDLHAARLSDSRFLVRLHGRIEVPDSIILARRHYDKIKLDRAYQSFFTWWFNFSNTVFFGFSFSDPHLTEMIKVAADDFGARFNREAYALFDRQPTSQLESVLSKAGIRVVLYDGANNHAEAWDLLTGTSSARVTVPLTISTNAVHRKMATVLTRLKFSDDTVSRAEVIAALATEGVARLLRARGVSQADAVVSHIIRELALSETDAPLVRDALVVLTRDGAVRATPEGYAAPDTPIPQHESPGLDLLVGSVLERARVRYRIATPRTDAEVRRTRAAIQEAITRALVADGLLVAHQLLRRAPVEESRLDEAVRAAIRSLPPSDQDLVKGYAPAIAHLLAHPDSGEEPILDKLTAACFAVCVLVVDPSMVASAETIRDRDLFVDANILMPWLCAGHPLQAFYADIWSGLAHIRPIVPSIYLNELVSHRSIALELYRDGKFEDPEVFRRYAQYLGTNHLNAFLAGWSGMLGADPHLTFPAYLERYAPFNTESKAADFVRSRGMAVFDLPSGEPHKGLSSRYRGEIASYLHDEGRSRESILVEHDAQMLAHLSLVGAEGGSFVTSDRTLLRALCQMEPDLRRVMPLVLLPHEATYILELTGRRTSFRGLSRAVWGIRDDRANRLRNYYTDRILRELEPALLKDMPSIVEEILDAVEKSGKLVAGPEDPSTMASVASFRALDQFEPHFHRLMDQARQRAGLS